jgi:predicted transcriptional regulator
MTENDQPLPTAAELDILNALWRIGPATVREVHEALGNKNGYTTTLKQMQVMTEKGLVIRSERFRAHVYEPGVPRERMRRRIAGDLLDRAFEGSARELILGALSAKPASAKELAEIRQMIAEFERKGGKKP